ncbi:MAG TPA: GFA family protein, partial [Myxococcota bacterium]|nr:GFA family protein [Myxococcota bacterium]
LPSLFCAHCHCSMCRRNHGAGYVTWFAVPREALTLERGGGDLVRFASSEHGSRSFCRRCGTSLFCENALHPERTDIPLGTVDGPIDRAPQAHAFFDCRADWVEIGDDLPRLGGKTGFEPLKER